MRQIPARRWLGLTATPYRRDELDDLIALQLGPVRHTMSAPEPGNPRRRPRSAGRRNGRSPFTSRPTSTAGTPTRRRPAGSRPSTGDLVADEARNEQVVADVVAALARGRHCLVLTQWTAHVDVLAAALRDAGHQLVVLKGGMGAGQRREALARLGPDDGAAARGGVLAPTLDNVSSIARRSTLCSWPRLLPSRGGSCSTSGGFCVRHRASTWSRCTTTTTSRPVCWRLAAQARHRLHQPRLPGPPSPSDTSHHRRRRSREGNDRERLQCGHRL